MVQSPMELGRKESSSTSLTKLSKEPFTTQDKHHESIIASVTKQKSYSHETPISAQHKLGKFRLVFMF